MSMLKKYGKYMKQKILASIMICMFNAIYFCFLVYLNTLEISVLKYMNLILLIFFAPELAWQACLKKAKVELELLTDIDMLLMVEKGTRGRICQAIYRYAKANNKYMKKNMIKNYIIIFNVFRC